MDNDTEKKTSSVSESTSVLGSTSAKQIVEEKQIKKKKLQWHKDTKVDHPVKSCLKPLSKNTISRMLPGSWGC